MLCWNFSRQVFTQAQDVYEAVVISAFSGADVFLQ